MPSSQDKAQPTIPAGLETVFLDAGNTLISMDYVWVLEELSLQGVDATMAELERAEAAARPTVSREMGDRAGQSGRDAFHIYLGAILERLEPTASLSTDHRAALVAALAEVLKHPGKDHRLWSRVLPGVAEALRTMGSAGLKLIVVSNSDGSVERALSDLGLGRYLDAVLDSAVVGFEKPDPDFFRHALRIAGGDPGRTIHVGDMYFQDVLGARGAGIEPVLLDPYDDWNSVDCIRRRSLLELANELVDRGL